MSFNRTRMFWTCARGLFQVLMVGAWLVTPVPDARAQMGVISGTATPDKLDTDITVFTLGAPAIYGFGFSPASGWTWYGDQYVSVGLSAAVTITTQWLAGTIVVPAGGVDWFESEYSGNLKPVGTGPGGGAPVTKPWHAYAWDHTLKVISDPMYVRVNGSGLTREGQTSASLTARGPDSRVIEPLWYASPAGGISFSPAQGWSTTISNTTLATDVWLWVTAQATKIMPFSGVISDTSQVAVVDVNITSTAVTEANEESTGVFVPVLDPTATSGGIPLSLSVGPSGVIGQVTLTASSANFAVYRDAAFANALLSGGTTSVTYTLPTAVLPSPVYLKGVTASTASGDMLTLAFTPSAAAGGGTPPEFKDKMKVSVIKVEITFGDPDDANWSDLEEKKVILSDKTTRIKLRLTPQLSNLQAIFNAFGTAMKIRTSGTASGGQDCTLTTSNTILMQGSGYSEMRVSLSRDQLKTLGVLPSQEADTVTEKAWLDHGTDNSTDPSNLTDGNAFDLGLTEETRGQSTNYGNLESEPPNSLIDKTFFVAAGREIITAEYANTVSHKRQIMNQADHFYYSGHGSHATATLQGGFGPGDVSGYWDKDLDYVTIAGCAVLDIKDYRSQSFGWGTWVQWYAAGGACSPGALWEPKGPKYFLGYNWTAPLDNQGSAAIITNFLSALNGGATVANAWRQANDLGVGRNACVIDVNSSPHVYWYWDETSGSPVWTSVTKSGNSW